MPETPSAPSFRVSTTTPAGTEITIRPYRPTDFGAVVDMYLEFHKGSCHELTPQKQGLPPKTEFGIQNWLRNLVDEPTLLAQNQDEVVGHLLFVQSDDGGHELGVFLHPRFRGPEFKSKLVKAGLEYAETLGISNVWLTTRPDETESQKIYEELGFTLDKVDKPVKIMWMSSEV